MNNKILKEDIQQFAEKFELWEQFRGKTFLITGATGLIGSVMIQCLLELDQKHALDLKIVAVIRDIEKAQRVFGEKINQLTICTLPLLDLTKSNLGFSVDYIIHLASPTSGR